ncbi:hypothetical protein [Paraburkholderia sp.]|uniref:hypothetical protein n=1 Tax=Paraburkholderia sp. TaxID=1926495 RepID=UPI00286FAC7F|nr:hypothetical protein [Paraburkholderia sp.]
MVTIATGNVAPEAKMRPLCALGVSAETSVPLAVALDVDGAPQVIVPFVTAAALVPPPLAALDVFEPAFCVPLAASEPDPPPPQAARSSDEESKISMCFIV